MVRYWLYILHLSEVCLGSIKTLWFGFVTHDNLKMWWGIGVIALDSVLVLTPFENDEDLGLLSDCHPNGTL